MNNVPYITLKPEDPRHRQFIRTAIQVADKAALNALRGRTDCPIHFVTNWFYHSLITGSDESQNVVIIWSPQTRLDFERATNERNQWNAPPAATYDFLKQPQRKPTR